MNEKIKITESSRKTGHMKPDQGCGVHKDKREKRKRTRKAKNDAAIREQQ